MKAKSYQDYEAEAIWVDGCLIHAANSIPDANKLSRKIYQLRHGKIESSEIHVCHKCDNPRCILDEHHFLGTRKDNMQDASKKGRLKRNPEWIAKFSATRKGHAVTQETRKKISDSKKGNPIKSGKRSPLSLEHREKIKKATTGKKKSEETKQRMKEAWVIRRGGKNNAS